MSGKEKSPSVPRVVLGTMTFGQQTDEEAADSMLRACLDSGVVELDTAWTYSEGRSEEILGRLLEKLGRDKFCIATKVNPQDGRGLGAESVRSQLETSLTRLKTDCVDLLYLHQPDPDTPVEDTLKACAELHAAGKFRELGLSNYSAWEAVHIWHLAKREGWPLPAVYQGMYNAITRQVEAELFPCLRQLGMRFYAYNPLAAGVLTGKYGWKTKPPEKGRFHEYKFYVGRYWKESCFQALDSVRAICGAFAVTPTEAALRWLVHHSAMAGQGDDAVIVGASRMEHLEQNLATCAGDALADEVVWSFDAAWEIARPDCPKYFRP